MSTAIIFPAQPEQILKGLGKLWTSLGEEEKQQGKPTVLRACAMTLVVATDEEDGGYSASQIISELMREHPSRGIVLAVSRQAEHNVEARVLAQCWKPFGKAQQICCEQIEIVAQPDSWPNVGPTLAGLTVADLPVIFWCRHKAALSSSATKEQQQGLQAVLDLSTKVIVDNAGEDPLTAFELIHRLEQKGRVVADLEWARLTFWRQPIAQIFDNPTRTNGFSKFHTVEIGHFGATPGPLAVYAAGWFSSISKAKVNFFSVAGDKSGLHCIRLISDEEVIRFERSTSDCLTLSSTNGRQRTYTYTEPSLYALLNEELSIIGADPCFAAAFRRAQELLIA
jgi:glucose-6-phosphate dehydrogenase assembly protein OpcA